MTVRTVLSLVLVMAVAPAGRADDLFVNNITGDDRNDGGAERSVSDGTGPLRTIARAMHLAGPSDRVIIANTGQPYRECVSLVGASNSGGPLGPFVVLGNGALLDGTVPVPLDQWEAVARDIFRYRPRLMHWQQLLADGGPLPRKKLGPEEVPSDETLEPLEWTIYRGEIYFRMEPGALLSGYNLAVAGHPAGLTLYKVHDVVIDDLIVQGYQLDGVNVHDSSQVVLTDMVSRANGRSGVAVVGASRARILGLAAGYNGVAQLLSDGPAWTVVAESLLIGDTAPEVVKRRGQVLVDGEPVK